MQAHVSKWRFEGRVAVVTGAGNGLGRSHAMLLASLGAKVLVNDLGTTIGGAPEDASAAQKVVDEIRRAGGEACANADSVEAGSQIIECALDTFGRVDVLINNAGILRDRSFHQMNEEDWESVYRTHLLGSYRCSHAAWPHLRRQGFGRIVFTVSGSGIYGNFGQANYAMAKLGTLGLAQSLAIEGRPKGIHVNCVSPVAGSRLPANLWPPEVLQAVSPELVSPLVAYLCHEDCEDSGGLYEVGGGCIARLRWNRSAGVRFPLTTKWSIDEVAANRQRINDYAGGDYPASIGDAFEPVLANLPMEIAAIWRAKTGELWNSSRIDKS